MSIDMKHNNRTVGVLMAADRQVNTRCRAMGEGRYRLDLTGCQRDDPRAAIDDAMQSVGQVLEVILQVMGDLRTARDALTQSYQDSGKAGKAG